MIWNYSNLGRCLVCSKLKLCYVKMAGSQSYFVWICMWINSLIGIRHGSGDDLKFSDLWHLRTDLMILSYEHAIFAALCSKPAGTSGRLQSTVNNPSIWAIYNDLSRGHPKWWFSKGIPPQNGLKLGRVSAQASTGRPWRLYHGLCHGIFDTSSNH